MATVTERGPEPDAAAWRAIGRLEGKVDALLEGQRASQEGQRDLSRRIDRLFYAILGIGGALLAAILATQYFGS